MRWWPSVLPGFSQQRCAVGLMVATPDSRATVILQVERSFLCDTHPDSVLQVSIELIRVSDKLFKWKTQ